MALAASRKRTIRWIGTLLGLGVTAGLVLYYDPKEVFTPLVGSQPSLLAPAIAFQAVTQILSAMALTVLLPAPQSDISWWRQLRVFLAVQPLALIAPGRVADFGVVPLLKGHQAPGTLASTVIMDKLVTLIYFGLAAPVAVHYISLESANSQILIAGPLLILLVVLASVTLANRHARSWVNRHILRRWPGLFAGFGTHLEFLIWTSRLRLAVNLAITGCKVIFLGLTLMFLSKNVDVTLSFAEAVCVGILLQVVTMVPLSIMGLGIGEVALAVLFSLMGHAESAAISVMLVGRVLFCTILAVIYFTVSVPVIGQKYGHKVL